MTNKFEKSRKIIMKLNNLPKDMLVELVANIRDDTEKEYCNYIVVHGDYAISYHIFNEVKSLKEFLLNHLCDYHDIKDVFSKESEAKVVKTLKHLATQKYSDYLNYINSLANKYSLEDLLEIVKRLEEGTSPHDSYRIHDIIKGKRLYDN
jgi:hypothetical protein